MQVPQLWHALPIMPQALLWSPGSHTSIEQQPVQPENVSQRHTPLRQRVPGPQGAPVVPHTQLPLVQRSAVTPSHCSQVPPPSPHAKSSLVPGAQVLPEQQPGQFDIESQTHVVPLQRVPVVHCAPVPHPQPPSPRQALLVVVLQLVQAEPPTPHCPVVGGVMHVAPTQQPLHDAESHTHAVPLQR